MTSGHRVPQPLILYIWGTKPAVSTTKSAVDSGMPVLYLHFYFALMWWTCTTFLCTGHRSDRGYSTLQWTCLTLHYTAHCSPVQYRGEQQLLHYPHTSAVSATPWPIPGIIGWKQRHSPLNPRLLPPHTNITQVTNPSVQRLYFLMICCIFSDNHRKSRKQIQQLLSDDLWTGTFKAVTDILRIHWLQHLFSLQYSTGNRNQKRKILII